MPTLQELKQQSPQYQQMSDGEFAFRMWNRFYKDRLPMGIYADRIGLDRNQFNEMIRYGSNEADYIPTGRTFAEGYEPTPQQLRETEISGYTPNAPLTPAQYIGSRYRPQLEQTGGAISTAMRGYTLGGLENVIAGVGAAGQKLFGNDRDRSFSDYYEDYLSQQRGLIKRYQEDNPLLAPVTEIAGAFASPIRIGMMNNTRFANLLNRSPILTSVVTSGASGGLYGILTSEGNARERIAAGGELVIPSASFGLGGFILSNLAPAMSTRLSKRFNESTRNPSIEKLQETVNEAYDAVDDSNITFQSAEISQIQNSVTEDMINRGLDLRAPDSKSSRINNILQNLIESPLKITLRRLDQARQNILNEFTNGIDKNIDSLVMGAKSRIDDLIQRYEDANSVMIPARAAYQNLQKSKLLNDIFKDLELSSTFKDMDNLTKYKEVLQRALLDVRYKNMFSKEEQELIKRFLDEGVPGKIGRTLQDLAPNSTGLMRGLQLVAYSLNPLLLVAGLVSKAVDTARQRSGVTGVKNLYNELIGSPSPEIYSAFPSRISPIIQQTPIVQSWTNYVGGTASPILESTPPALQGLMQAIFPQQQENQSGLLQ